MLNVEDFDFYYLIICSRGLGSETMVVQDVTERRNEVMFMDNPYGNSEDQFQKFGACEAEADWNDEGPIIAVPKSTKPLKNIYQWLLFDTKRLGEQNGEIEEGTELSKFMEQINKVNSENGDAYLSACIRAFLPSKISSSNLEGIWTSCNAWRDLDLEIPSKEQFLALTEAMGLTGEQLVNWNCRVLRESLNRLLLGTLTNEEFVGC